MENVVGVTEHIKKKIAEAGGDTEREVLTVFKTSSGENYVKTEDGSDEFQKQLTIPGDGTYVISVKSGAGTVSKQFIVR